MLGLRAALARWAAAIPPGVTLDRPTDLADLLNLKPKLAWQLWRVINAQDAVEAHGHLPGPAGLRIALEAAARRGVSADHRESVEQAFERVRQLTDQHAGDRHALATMLGSRGGSAAQRSAEELRRMAFAGNSAIWGVRVRVQLMLSILHPGKSNDLVDAAAVRGVFDLQRLRPSLPWVIARIGCYSTAEQRKQRRREPITPVGSSGVPLLREFCSPAMPELTPIAISETLADIELAESAVGEEGAVTCVFGEVFRNLPRYREPEPASGAESGERGSITPVLFTPTEIYIHDLLVHPGAEPLPPWRVSVYGDARGEGFTQTRARNRIPLDVAAEPLGRGRDGLAAPYLPRYAELVGHVHEQLGWDPDDFTAHRIRINYPLVPSMVAVDFDLPEAP